MNTTLQFLRRTRPWLSSLTGSLAVVLFTLIGAGVAWAQPSAIDLLERARDARQADTLTTKYRVNIVRPDWQRKIDMIVHEDQIAQRYSAELTAPRKFRGTQFLKANDRLWMYMPKLRRQVGISPSMMLEPWMGSDLNNQDLLEADALLDAYDHSIVSREESEGSVIYTILSKPKPGSAVVWGHLEQRITEGGVPLNIDYFDQDGTLSRRVTFSGPRNIGGRTVPTLWRITPMPDAGSYTEVQVESIEFNQPLPEKTFARIPNGDKSG